jgi:hypothetical protein
MRTLVLQFGLGRLHLSPANGSELVVDCAPDERPLRSETADRVTLSAQPRTLLGISVPRPLNWTLHVPADFSRIVIQAAGATVVSDHLEWADVRLEGAATRLACQAGHLGTLALVGTGQRAELQVERLDRVSLDGLNNHAMIVHGDTFAIERLGGGPACRIDAPTAQPSAQHRLQCCLNGLHQVVEVQHAAA